MFGNKEKYRAKDQVSTDTHSKTAIDFICITGVVLWKHKIPLMVEYFCLLILAHFPVFYVVLQTTITATTFDYTDWRMDIISNKSNSRLLWSFI